jgi:hypothetical protein
MVASGGSNYNLRSCRHRSIVRCAMRRVVAVTAVVCGFSSIVASSVRDSNAAALKQGDAVSVAPWPTTTQMPSACTAPTTGADTSLVDTLPRYASVTGLTYDTAGHIQAAKDALVGRSGFPPPLLLVGYRREGTSVVVDLRADSLPRVRWRNAGGTVRIRNDGCRIILTRHD